MKLDELRNVFKEIKDDFQSYMSVKNYTRKRKKREKKDSGIVKVIMLAAFVITVSVAIVGVVYAQGTKETYVVTPEPNTMWLLLTGTVGWFVRLARKRFLQAKMILDRIFAGLGLILLSPVMGFTALYIKMVSPGPAIFKQCRVGKGGKLFMIYKLRTMRVDAEKQSGAVWAQENDPRFIKGGKLLRKMHLDEFPQLLNVLKGEMSIVGPRPERPVFVESLSKEIPDYKKRLEVKPGITGLAQVWHKYDETVQDVKKKIKYDILYIKRMCFLTDLSIIFRTVYVAAIGKGAR